MRYEGEGNNSIGVSRPFAHGSGASPLHKTAILNSTNGHGSPISNGSTFTNGQSHGRPKSSYFGHDREEISRILIQALTDLGYHGAAVSLSQESGYDLECPSVAAFRNAVLQGEWVEAEALLFGGHPEGGGVTLTRTGGLTLREGTNRNLMRFWLREQKFLELLELRDTGRALMVLRTELTPLYQDTSKLHALSSLLMCQSAEHVKAKAGWDGARGESRCHLLSALSRCITPSLMLPEHRLAVLLHQVKKQQIATCMYHNTVKSPSLYQDHICNRADFPVLLAHEFKDGGGEIWNCAFSNDGTRIASCGSDGVVFIYDMETLARSQILSEHEEGISSIAWSPDDSSILTCSQDKRARLFNTKTGEKIGSLPKFGEPASSCAWVPDGKSFVIGCLEKERNLCQYDINGSVIYDWGRPHRIQDLAISSNGHYLVAMSCENHVYVYNFDTRSLEHEIDFKTKLTSVAISKDSKCILVRKNDGEAKMLDIGSREILRDYGSVGRPCNVVIRGAFGGANESFVVTGSETGMLYIYHKESGVLVETLGRKTKGCCNAVSWNPTNPSMLASCGDDGVVRIWSNKELIPRAALQNSEHSNGQDQGSNGW